MPSDEDKRKEAKQDAKQRQVRDKAPAKYEFGLEEGPFHEQYPERQQSVPAPAPESAPAQGPTITVMPRPQAIPAPQPIAEQPSHARSPARGSEQKMREFKQQEPEPGPRPESKSRQEPVPRPESRSGQEPLPSPESRPGQGPVPRPEPRTVPVRGSQEPESRSPAPLPAPDIRSAEVKATEKGKMQTLFERLRILVGTNNEEMLLLGIKQGKSEKHINKIRDSIATSMPLDKANTDELTGILQEIRRESWHTQFRGGLSGTVLIPTQSTMDAIAKELHSIHHPPSHGAGSGRKP